MGGSGYDWDNNFSGGRSLRSGFTTHDDDDGGGWVVKRRLRETGQLNGSGGSLGSRGVVGRATPGDR
jgi:hypothetical protein